MPLHSSLLRGDSKLEAAAAKDPAHITPGDVGLHVSRIQQALLQTDGATIVSTELQTASYGPSTANAVLSFKRKRNIVNRAYQSQADNIVGKMTVAALDAELVKLDQSRRPIVLRVISPTPDNTASRPAASRLFALPTVGAPSFSPGPVVTIDKGKTALVEVRNAAGASIVSSDPTVASARAPGTVSLSRITSDPQTIEIVGHKRGGAVIVVNLASAPPLSLPQSLFMAAITISVREKRTTHFTPTMVPHNHLPTRRFGDLLKVIEQPTHNLAGKALKALCVVGADPMTFVNAAIAGEFSNKPIALKHLNWYLRDGHGLDFDEDENIEKWIPVDPKVRLEIANDVRANRARGLHKGFINYDFSDFGPTDDFQFAFGTIDRLDWEVDVRAATIKIFFMDRYEWHPVSPGFYTKHADDVVRFTNSLHAALVELKDRGAADFWMVGEATFPLSVFGL